MRTVIQRVLQAAVTVEGRETGRIEQGLLVLLGIASNDTIDDVTFMTRKLAGLRIFADDQGLMNRSIHDVQGSFLIVSQFTLYGDATRGNRPNFMSAATGTYADGLYQQVCLQLRERGFDVQTGTFGAHMEVTLVNDGPVTILLESDSRKMK